METVNLKECEMINGVEKKNILLHNLNVFYLDFSINSAFACETLLLKLQTIHSQIKCDKGQQLDMFFKECQSKKFGKYCFNF